MQSSRDQVTGLLLPNLGGSPSSELPHFASWALPYITQIHDILDAFVGVAMLAWASGFSKLCCQGTSYGRNPTFRPISQGHTVSLVLRTCHQ